MSRLHIIIKKPAWYRDSEELELAFNLFYDIVRDDPAFNTILLQSSQSPEKENPVELDEHISKALAEIKQQSSDKDELIFFVNEPALLMSKDVIFRMADVLLKDYAECIVPASYPHEYPGNANQHYFTFNGYLHYVNEVLKTQADAVKAFDGRTVYCFAIKHSFISAHQISDHYLQIPARYPEQTAIAAAAYIHPFADYFNGANLDMLEYIPNSARTLLDIGCSSGEFGQAVTARLGLQVEGIEINTTAARIAQSKLHRLYQGNALELVTEHRFDCVTCLDVLEHFPNPDVLLQRISSHYLNDHGVLLLNLPNIGHWSIVDDLLSGHWDYLPGGTLCNTHLRFFTRKTIADMMARNQYDIIEIIPTQAALPDTVKKRYTLLEQDGKRIDWENLKTISFKVIAHKHHYHQ